jgi:hypothetical protein
MPTRKFKVRQELVQGKVHLGLQHGASSDEQDVPESTIESELFDKIIKKYNPAYDPGTGDYVGALGSEQLKKLHEQGPYMFLEQFLYQGGGSGQRLGGLLVPPDKKSEIFQDLRAIGYQLEE